MADDGVSFREKIASIGFMRSSPSRREYRRDDGVRVKEVTDEAGNVLTWRGDKEAADVEIRPKTVTLADGRVLTHREDA